MVVKAQVARKLASRDPAQAAQQATDIEEIGRAALSEVRQAVAGYRGRGLARELEAARAALAGTIAWSLSVWWLGEAITVIFTGVQASTPAASPTAWPPIPTAVRCSP